ncbi:hypothetical protein Q3G72_030278 [Acer saccharum]|nr:hypothetical protein Q3G72_030278 [Acer saccharum]
MSGHPSPRKKTIGSGRPDVGPPDPMVFFIGPRWPDIGAPWIDDEECAFGFELGWRMEKSSWVSMTTLPQTFYPSMPIEIVDDDDVALLLRRENVDPLVCISVEEIGHESLEMKHKPPESYHNLHHTTPHHEFHHTHKSNIHVNTMDEFQRSDVPNMAAHLDYIGEGFTQIANIDTSPPHHLSFQDTTGNQHIPEHDETEPQFNYNREGAPNRYDEQFAHVQRLVPPPCAFYSINSGEVAPRPITMRLELGELFPSKKQLQLQVGSYALNNQFQIRVFKSDTTQYQVQCIVEDCN